MGGRQMPTRDNRCVGRAGWAIGRRRTRSGFENEDGWTILDFKIDRKLGAAEDQSRRQVTLYAAALTRQWARGRGLCLWHLAGDGWPQKLLAGRTPSAHDTCRHEHNPIVEVGQRCCASDPGKPEYPVHVLGGRYQVDGSVTTTPAVGGTPCSNGDHKSLGRGTERTHPPPWASSTSFGSPPTPCATTWMRPSTSMSSSA